jgi:hypothetical protein
MQAGMELEVNGREDCKSEISEQGVNYKGEIRKISPKRGKIYNMEIMYKSIKILTRDEMGSHERQEVIRKETVRGIQRKKN